MIGYREIWANSFESFKQPYLGAILNAPSSLITSPFK